MGNSNTQLIPSANGRSVGTFSYDGLKPEVADKLRKVGAELAIENQKFTGSMMRIGRQCLIAHEIFKGDGRDGKFKNWVEAETPYDRRFAYRAKRIYSAFTKAKCANFAHFSVSAMDVLSADAVPEAAIKAADKLAAELAKKGKRITAAKARELIEQYTVDSGGNGEAKGMISKEAEPVCVKVRVKWPRMPDDADAAIWFDGQMIYGRTFPEGIMCLPGHTDDTDEAPLLAMHFDNGAGVLFDTDGWVKLYGDLSDEKWEKIWAAVPFILRWADEEGHDGE